MTLQEFLVKYEGKSIDQGWGVQCVAIVRHYWERVHNMTRSRQPNTTPSGGALDLINNVNTPFRRLARGEIVLPGDVAVWAATANNRWGHTAIVTEMMDGQFEVLEQDGFNQHRGAYRKLHRIDNTLSGFIRV